MNILHLNCVTITQITSFTIVEKTTCLPMNDSSSGQWFAIMCELSACRRMLGYAVLALRLTKNTPSVKIPADKLKKQDGVLYLVIRLKNTI